MAGERTVLVVDDEVAIRAALEANFRKVGWSVHCASGRTDALTKFQQQTFPLVVTDIRMPDGDGLQIMREVRKLAPETAVILLTAYGNVPDAVDAMKGGACDYLVKPVSFEQLQSAVNRVMQRGFKRSDGELTSEIIGHSPLLLDALDRARKAARTDADVLIEAESGTGKELLAKLIHGASDRSGSPLVAVNCAAVPDTLLESELFGHVRGAFTGAIVSKPGKFELANGGTLLLDEVGEMPLGLQPKLLRVLQEREIERLGDARPIKVNIRVVATTNRSLRSMVEEGKFRSDLFYRLNVIPLTLPPLRDRCEDIAELACYFASKYARSGSPEVSAKFLDGLVRYSWPGNVRELANFMRRVVALCTASTIGDELLEPHMRLNVVGERSAPNDLKAGVSLREIERRLLEVTLNATDGNRTKAAEMLGVSIRTIRNRIRDYGLPKRSYA